MTENRNELKEMAVEAIADKKGRKTAVIDLSDMESAPAPHLVICQGNSTAQVSAIADSVRDSIFKKSGTKPYHYEGYRNSQWIVIDYGELMVHVFLPDYRQFYNLEGLWNDAPVEYLPDLD